MARVCLIVFLLATAANAQTDPFVGTFTAVMDGEQYRLTIQSRQGAYRGTLSVDGERIPLRGQRRGEELIGELSESGERYQFVAHLRDGALFFEDESGEAIVFQPTGRAQSAQASQWPQQQAAHSPAPQTNNMPPAQQPQQQAATAVVINGAALSPQDVAQLAAAGIQVYPGQYWYDPACGAWGFNGGPTMGFIQAGIPVRAPLAPNASNGNTGVFINGRQLPLQDLLALQTLTGPLQPARYFIDGYGNAGYEGGLPLINLRAAAVQAGGGQGGNWQSSVTGNSSAWDGQGSGFVMLKDASGRPTTVGY